MIEFVTLLLGLVTGTQAVEVSADERVTRVEFRLDGKTLETLTEPPWYFNCDFGGALAPHELVAIAFDADDEELGRVRQWVNLPRERVEARLALDRKGDAPATARLIWSALDHERPKNVVLTFDGQPLAADDLRAIVLPPHDPASLHFLRAELEFSASERTYAELVFGGTYGDEVSTELTAVVLATTKKAPRPEQMAGWLTKRGQPLQVVAVDKGPVNLLFIREKTATVLEGLKASFEQKTWQKRRARRPQVHTPVLGPNDRVRFAFPTAGRKQQVVGQGSATWSTEQVPVSLDVADYGPLFDILTSAFYPDQDLPLLKQQLADAVAIGGVVAASGDQRRMLVLIRSAEAQDTSRFSATEAERYLGLLRVPFRVWTITPEVEDPDEQPGPPPPIWQDERDVSGALNLRHALNDLRKDLESQIVVWVEGAHMTHEIELSEKAVGLRPAS
ncbi:MAG: hypothetical protein AAF657_07915 [Acidobacteriota bacterium]